MPAAGDPLLASDIRDVLDRLSPEHRAVLVLRDLEGLDERTVGALLAVAAGHGEVAAFPGPHEFPKGVGPMNRDWPVADLDPVRRLAVLAATVPGGAIVVEEVIDAPFERVWAVAGDLEHEFPLLVRNVRSMRVVESRTGIA